MEKVKERITHYSLYVTALLKWLAVGALVGGVGGFVGGGDAAGVCQEGVADVGQFDAAAGAGEQVGAEFGFECLDLFAQ